MRKRKKIPSKRDAVPKKRSEITKPPNFKKFDPIEFLETAAKGRALTTHEKREIIFTQGDAADSVFYIKKGKIKVTVISRHGKEAVVALLGVGEFLGEGCLIGQPKRLATATAMTECQTMRVDKREIMRVLQNEPTFSEMFIAHILARNARVEEDLADQLFNSTEKRLARLLLLLANFGKEGRPEPIIAKISQETLAERTKRHGIGPGTVFENALASLESQVQPIEGAITLLQFIDNGQALQVVLESAVLAHAGIQRVLPGMTERRVAEIVSQRNGLGQIFVSAQVAGNRTGNLGDFKAVRQACAEQIAFMIDKNLGLVFEAPKGSGVNNTVAVALKFTACCRGRLRMRTAPRCPGSGSIGGQHDLNVIHAPTPASPAV